MRSNWNRPFNPYEDHTAPNPAPTANRVDAPADALAARQDHLITLLRRVLPRHVNPALVTRNTLKDFVFQRIGVDSAIVDRNTRGSETRWRIHDADPALLTDLDNVYAGYTALQEERSRAERSVPYESRSARTRYGRNLLPQQGMGPASSMTSSSQGRPLPYPPADSYPRHPRHQEMSPFPPPPLPSTVERRRDAREFYPPPNRQPLPPTLPERTREAFDQGNLGPHSLRPQFRHLQPRNLHEAIRHGLPPSMPPTRGPVRSHRDLHRDVPPPYPIPEAQLAGQLPANPSSRKRPLEQESPYTLMPEIAHPRPTRRRIVSPPGLRQQETFSGVGAARSAFPISESPLPQRISYSPFGFAVRQASPVEQSKLVSQSGAVYDLDIYVDSQIRSRLNLGSGTIVGGGANGTIHLARSENGEIYALKEMSNAQDAQKEFGNHKKLGEGPHFVTAYDLIQTDKSSYIVMDLIVGKNGRDLVTDILTNSHLSLKEKSDAIVSAVNGQLAALYAMHERGYCHSDVHPGNFLHEDTAGLTYICDLERMSELSESLQSGEYRGMGYELNRISRRAREHNVHIPALDEVADRFENGRGVAGTFVRT